MKWLVQGTKDGRINFGDYNAKKFRQYLRENGPVRLEVKVVVPESRKQRGFYHGAVIAMIAYYQEGMSHRSSEDLDTIHNWLKIELNGEWVAIAGKSAKVGKSTKGELNLGFLERVLDWMTEQGYKTELLDPSRYKQWRDEIYSSGGPDTYIDYLVSLKLLP